MPEQIAQHYFVRAKNTISTPPTTPRLGIRTPRISSYTVLVRLVNCRKGCTRPRLYARYASQIPYGSRASRCIAPTLVRADKPHGKATCQAATAEWVG